MVSNLPKYYTEERLRKDFGVIGIVTDSRIIRLKDGTSRRFGFVGFKTDQEAKKALRYFNNTYVDTCKIRVEPAVRYGDDLGKDIWSKHTKAKLRDLEKLASKEGAQPSQKINRPIASQIEAKKKILRTVYELEKDPQAQMLLQAMRPASSKSHWRDEAIDLDLGRGNKVPGGGRGKVIVTAVPNKKPGGEGLHVTKSHVKFDSGSGSDCSDEYQDLPGLNSGGEDQIECSTQQLSPTDDGDQKRHLLEMETAKVQDKQELPQDVILRTGRLFLTNISYACIEEDIVKLFEKYGVVTDAHIVLDKRTKQSTGMAFVRLLHPEHALRAFSELHKSVFQGRVLNLSPGEAPPEPRADVGGRTFKQKRLEDRKALSGKSFNWASFFMNTDTVAEAAASKLGISKGELLDGEADNVAVRLALAETNVIQEAKQYLRDNGINVDSFESRGGQHSSNTIVVKNIPAGVSGGELRGIFDKYGEVRRIIIPPTAAIAVVSYAHGRDAKVAFSKLAYSQLREVPLFLEWAPRGVFSAGAAAQGQALDDTSAGAAAQEQDVADRAEAKESEDSAGDEGSDEDTLDTTTLYITNLNFKTTEADLRQHLEAYTGIRSVKIATRLKKGDLVRTSMGFGFVEFESGDLARSALASLKSSLLHDHKLQFKLSKSAGVASEPSLEGPQAARSNKLAVRNIPFQASKHELRELFKSFGELKTLRLPKKLDGQHRGFGFVEYISKQDAGLAFESLKSTHLYGRHLVIEWAEDCTGLEALRHKTASGIAKTFDLGRQRKRKLEVADRDD